MSLSYTNTITAKAHLFHVSGHADNSATGCHPQRVKLYLMYSNARTSTGFLNFSVWFLLVRSWSSTYTLCSVVCFVACCQNVRHPAKGCVVHGKVNVRSTVHFRRSFNRLRKAKENCIQEFLNHFKYNINGICILLPVKKGQYK